MAQEQGLVGSVLSPAIALWLRSQAQAVGTLQVEIGGSGRQLLGGQIPEVRVQASGIVYDGMHFRELAIAGRNIRTNLGQMMRGQPFRLLERIDIDLEMTFDPAGFTASLDSRLWRDSRDGLATALAEALAWDTDGWRFVLAANHLRAEQGDRVLAADFALGGEDHLRLSGWRWLAGSSEQDLGALEGLRLSLGTDIAFDSFAVVGGEIRCCGRAVVWPDVPAAV